MGKALQGLVKTRAAVERISLAQQRFEDMQDGEVAAQFMVDRLRSIGDGIAWRLVNYDRPTLRLLSEHQPVSAPQLDVGLASEVRELLKLADEQTGPVILNSVTNFLRVGDITIYEPDTGEVRLVEVKSSSRSTARTRRQGQYMSVVQEGLKTGVHQTAGVQLHRLSASKPLKTHVFSVEQAMREAEKRYGASRLFGDYMAVAVFAQKKIIDDLPESHWADMQHPHIKRLSAVQRYDSDVVLPRMDSAFAVTHFNPNLAPYSIFPIEPRLRFALLSGKFLVVSVLNVSGLARWLQKRGWKAEVLPLSNEMPGPDEFPDIGVLRVFRGRIGAEIGLTGLTVAAMEFHMRESIELTAEAIIQDVPRNLTGEQERYSQINFPNSGKYAWD